MKDDVRSVHRTESRKMMEEKVKSRYKLGDGKTDSGPGEYMYLGPG